MGRTEKLVITFDEDARKEFVTGFRKRKERRRKVAKKQVEVQAREAKREMRASKKARQLESVTTTEMYSDVVTEPAAMVPADTTGTLKVSDDFSKRAFGADAVVVTTTLGLPEFDDAAEEDLLASFAKRGPPPAKKTKPVAAAVGAKRKRTEEPEEELFASGKAARRPNAAKLRRGKEEVDG